MTLALQAAGSITFSASTSTLPAVTLASTTPGDLNVVTWIHKRTTAGLVSIPAGWTQILNNQSSALGAAYGAGAGDVSIEVWARVFVTGDPSSITGLTISGNVTTTASGDVFGVNIQAFRSTSGGYDLAHISTVISTAATAWALTGALTTMDATGTNIASTVGTPFVAGDLLAVFYGMSLSTTTVSAQAITQTGGTFAAATISPAKAASTVGADLGIGVYTSSVTTAGTGNITAGITQSAGTPGVRHVLRVREGPVAVSGITGSMSFSGTAAAAADSGTASGSMSFSATAGDATYNSIVNNHGPWGAWNPSETSGATIADDSNNSRPLTITGTPTAYAVAGPRYDMFGISWPATTTDSAVTAATVAGGLSTGDFAIEAWIFMSALPAAVVNLIQVQSTTTNYFGLRLLTTGAVRMTVQAGGGTLRDTAVLTTGVWHHIVGKYSNGVAYIRVDKSSTATISKTVTLTGATVFTHGGQTAGAGALIIGPIAFYDQALSDAASDSHYDSGFLVVGVAGAGVATGSLTFSATVAAIASAAGSMALAGTAVQSSVATGSMAFGGTADGKAVGAATGSMDFSGTAIQSSVASGSITLAGSAAGAGAGSASGSMTFNGTAVQSSVASGSMSFAGSVSSGNTATGSIDLAGTAIQSSVAAGSITLAATADAAAPGVASGSLTLSGSTDASAEGTASGSITLSGGADLGADTSAAGSLTLAGSGSPRADTAASGDLTFSATGTAVAIEYGPWSDPGTGTTSPAAAVATGSLTLSGTVAARAAGAASGSITLAGSASVAAAITATGSITLTGSVTAAGASIATGTITFSGVVTLLTDVLVVLGPPGEVVVFADLVGYWDGNSLVLIDLEGYWDGAQLLLLDVPYDLL